MLKHADNLLDGKPVLHDPKDDKVNFCQIVQENGFLCDEHHVTTADGYVLGMFRVRSRQVAAMRKGKAPAVLLQHGYTASSDCFIVNEEKSPAFALANAGFDVWLGNNRGNKYSRKNVHFHADLQSENFFDYSFEDLAKFDVPALLDYVIHATGRPKVSFVGHSQGTAQMFAALAMNEEAVFRRVNFFGALAPVARMAHAQRSGLKELRG